MRIFVSLVFLASLVLLTALIVNASEGEKMKAEELNKLADKELIAMAVERIRDDSFALENFDNVFVIRKPGSVFVSLQMRYRYAPKNSKAYYAVGVDIGGSFSVRSTLTNPKGFNSGEMASFFQPDDEFRKVTEMVRSLLGDECTDDCYVEIMDEENYYRVTQVTTSYEYFFKLEKGTGRVYDEGNADFVEDDDLEEPSHEDEDVEDEIEADWQ